jgi:hypothetical protein
MQQIKIQYTTNYKMFKVVGGNRKIDEKRVLSIMESMKKNPEIVAPAQCNQKYEVIDGQHRLEASKRLSKPFCYYVVKGADIATVRTLNNHDPRWSTSEFTNSFVKTGSTDYAIYEAFEKKYGFGHAVNISLLTGAAGFHNRMLDDFKEGKFVVKNLVHAEKLADMLIEIGKMYPGYKKRSFAIAFAKLAGLPGFDFKRLVSKLTYQQKSMVDCTNSTQYLVLLGEIYNYRAKKGTILDVTSILYKK